MIKETSFRFNLSELQGCKSEKSDSSISVEPLLREHTSFLVIQFSPTIRLAIAHQVEDFILDCEFKGTNYSKHCIELRHKPEVIINPRFGVCYSFNYYPPASNSTLKVRSGG